MQRYKATIEYCGTNYCGMQKQSNETKRSIQSAIELALEDFFHTKINIEFCGRTDAGVHAFGQVIHFDLPTAIDEYRVLRGLNFFLQKNHENIDIIDIKAVKDTFHARFSCLQKTYLYLIVNRQIPSSILTNRALHVSKKLNIDKMKIASAMIVNKKLDFTSFQNKTSQCVNPNRTIDSITINTNGDIIYIHISAKSFLYRMVRNIVGTLINIGHEKNDPCSIINTIEQKDRTAAGKTVAPYGLYFHSAIYQDE